MQPDQRLIKKFQEGKCTPAEAQLVMGWLLEKESLPVEEWSDLSPAGDYPDGSEEEMLGFIIANKPQAPVRRMIPWKQMVAAASILLVVGLVFQHHKQAAPVAAEHLTILPTTQLTITAPGSHSTTVHLADGSTAVLEPGAVLRYDSAAYNKQDRVLQLEGQAVFTVATVKDKPFSVNAHGYSTTALGTSFMVSTKKSFLVKLFSGKIMVQQLQTTAKPVYLKPGEQLGFDHQTNQLVLSRWQTMDRLLLAESKGVHYSGDTLVFENVPLTAVLDLLHKRYQVGIQYDRKTLSNAYFTGQVLPGDAIELILRTVTRINDLSLIAADDGFIIK